MNPIIRTVAIGVEVRASRRKVRKARCLCKGRWNSRVRRVSKVSVVHGSMMHVQVREVRYGGMIHGIWTDGFFPVERLWDSEVVAHEAATGRGKA